MIGSFEQAIRRASETNGELTGALFVLESPLVAEQARAHVDPDNEWIDREDILGACRSLSQRLLVEAALSIWSTGDKCWLGALLRQVDDDNLVRVFVGILLSRSLVTVNEAYSMLAAFQRGRVGPRADLGEPLDWLPVRRLDLSED